jgi:hypothetical protein
MSLSNYYSITQILREQLTPAKSGHFLKDYYFLGKNTENDFIYLHIEYVYGENILKAYRRYENIISAHRYVLLEISIFEAIKHNSKFAEWFLFNFDLFKNVIINQP